MSRDTLPISVVIPAYNGREMLANCLQSLAEQSRPTAQTIVIDDASTDDVAAMVRAQFPCVDVYRLASNHRFCGAANIGLRIASQPFVFLLNNDMTPAPDCLETLFARMNESGAEIVGPLVLWRGDPATIYTAGDRQRVNGRPESIGYREPRDTTATITEEVFGISMCAALYRREVFDRIGLIDEHYIDYFSDSDFNFRARLAGFSARLVPDAVAYHIGSASLLGQNWRRSRQCCRNHAYLVLKNMPLPLLLRHAPAILAERLHQYRMTFSSARCESGALRAFGILLATWLACCAQVPRALVMRRSVQRSRTVPPSEFRRLLTP